MSSRKFFAVAVLAASALVIAACGGGGDVYDTPAASANNPFKDLVGTYKSGCVGQPSDSSYLNLTLTISNPTGTDQASVTADVQAHDALFSKSATPVCNADNLKLSAKLAGSAQALSATKSAPLAGKTVTAKAAKFTMNSFNMSKGSITVPALGTNTTIGYYIEGDKIYFLRGSRDVKDGLPSTFSSVPLVKQP